MGEAVPPSARLNGRCKVNPETRGERQMQQKMVRISVQVSNGKTGFQVGVQAPSIREALGVVTGRYPQGVAEVVFPIEPEGFFVREQIQKEAA